MVSRAKHGKNNILLLPSPPLQPRRDARPLATNLDAITGERLCQLCEFYQSLSTSHQTANQLFTFDLGSWNLEALSVSFQTFQLKKELFSCFSRFLRFFACFAGRPLPGAARTAAAWRRRSRRRQARLGFAGHGGKPSARKTRKTMKS